MIVNFHLPGLRQNYPLNMLILNLLKTKPDWFREGVRIASFFGEFPTSLWNGGRPSNYDQCDASFIQNVIKNINAKLSEYIMPYVSSDNKKYMTLSLELIVADKLMLNRDKDREDIEKTKILLPNYHFIVHEMFSQHSINGEIIKKGMDKGLAIKKVVETLHMKMEDTIAFGDSMNDYEMLQVCNYGVAMKNACQELKASADNICESVENDGVYYEMERLGLFECLD